MFRIALDSLQRQAMYERTLYIYPLLHTVYC
jgi:hypothetical protein